MSEHLCINDFLGPLEQILILDGPCLLLVYVSGDFKAHTMHTFLSTL